MTAILKIIEVGSWPMNCYLIACPDTRRCAIVDPGADVSEILAKAVGYQVDKILITHGHEDHVGAMKKVKTVTNAVVYINPDEARSLSLDFDEALIDGMGINIGNTTIRAIHTPGHTPGMTCLDLSDQRIIVGDTIFVGGPGKTWSAEDFTTTMETIKEIVFKWSDETVFYPGHGASGLIGEERPKFDNFVAHGWDNALFGDITWSGL